MAHLHHNLLAQSLIEGEHWVLFLGVALLFAAVMFGIRKRTRGGGRPKALTPQEHVERARQMRGMHGELEGLMVEIEELARRFSAQLDAKAMHLESLLREADQRIETLRRLQQGDAPRPADDSSTADAPSRPPAESRADASSAEPSAPDGSPRPNPSANDASAPDDAPPPPPAASSSDAAGPCSPSQSAEYRSTSAAADLPPDPAAARICHLADQGMEAPDIARMLQEHIGKVELILALRKSAG